MNARKGSLFNIPSFSTGKIFHYPKYVDEKLRAKMRVILKRLNGKPGGEAQKGRKKRQKKPLSPLIFLQ